MTTPEGDILELLLTRLERLQSSLADDLRWMEGVPADLDTFEAMPSHRQSASRAVLKSFEQIEDQLARAFRVIPRLVGEDSSRWFARDVADYMEKLGILDDAGRWSDIVKLRNELVHDYPLDSAIQFERLLKAIGFLPELGEAHRRLVAFVANDLPEHRI